jgi:hypothetical protein
LPNVLIAALIVLFGDQIGVASGVRPSEGGFAGQTPRI